MPYAKVITPIREALVALEPTNWRRSYKELFNQTDVSGWEEWHAYSHNGFNNLFQQADEARHDSQGAWVVIFRDKVREGGKGTDNKGRLDLAYVSHAGTAFEKTHSDIWTPKNGWYVPTQDGIFYEGTLIPFETLQNRKEAIRRLEAKGIPPEQVSFFWRPERYDNGRFVGRGFGPLLDGYGRFGVYVLGLPSRSGDDRVASRPAYKPTLRKWRNVFHPPRIIFSSLPEIVMEVRVPEAAKAK